MGYWVELVDSKTEKVIEIDSNHFIKGGTYQLGGSKELFMTITYNYYKFFKKAFNDEEGIRTLYGKTGNEAIASLNKAIAKLKGDITSNYWDAVEGNAKRALENLRELCKLAPDAIVKGD